MKCEDSTEFFDLNLDVMLLEGGGGGRVPLLQGGGSPLGPFNLPTDVDVALGSQE